MNVIRAGSYGALLGITAFAIVSAGCAAVEEVGEGIEEVGDEIEEEARDARR